MKYLPFIGRGFGLALFLFCTTVIPIQADVGIFTRFDTQLISEFEPLHTAIGDWGTGMLDGERQWALGTFEVGARYSGVEVSVQQRALADLRINEEAVKFYSLVEAEKALVPGATVPVQIRINGFSAQGLRLGYQRDIANLTMAAGVTWLKASHLMSGELRGQFAALAIDQYSVDAEVDYFYYRDIIFKRENINTARGEGAAFDLRIAWRPTERWYFEAQGEDLFTNIRWRDAPFTIATAKTNRKNYDEDGYAFFNPLFSGRQGYRDTFTQEIEPRYIMKSRYMQGDWSLYLEGRQQFGYRSSAVGAGYTAGSGANYKFLFWPTEQIYELEIARGKWSAGLKFDHISWSEMHSFSMNIAYNYDTVSR